MQIYSRRHRVNSDREAAQSAETHETDDGQHNTQTESQSMGEYIDDNTRMPDPGVFRKARWFPCNNVSAKDRIVQAQHPDQSPASKHLCEYLVATKASYAQKSDHART